MTMGNLPSLWDENRTVPPANREKSHDSVTIKLSCADFGTFNGRSDQWISFKENTLSKAGVGVMHSTLNKDSPYQTATEKETIVSSIYYRLPLTEGGHLM